MAFRQSHRPPPLRQLSVQANPPDTGVASSAQRKRPLEDTEEWVLFSPGAPSTVARTQTTSTERTPRTAGLSRFSDFGSLDTAARSLDHDVVTEHGTEEGEELDSLDDGLHAFHEPSDYGFPTVRLQQSGETVLPTHDGLGTFQPDADLHNHLWQFEQRRPVRRPHARRRSSVQRRLDLLEFAEESNQEQERRQRIESWRLEQSRALLQEIERETRRRRRMSVVSAARSAGSVQQDAQTPSIGRVAQTASDSQCVTSDVSAENLSFWERLTRRVIRDLMGIDEDTLSVIFGESLPQDSASDITREATAKKPTDALPPLDIPPTTNDCWEYRLLERVARELGILVSQLSEHPGAFSTYRRTLEIPEYAGRTSSIGEVLSSADTAPSTPSHSTRTGSFEPTFQGQPANTYSEASLWGIEEEAETTPSGNPSAAENLAGEREYWERELDVKMVFNFLLQRFSRRSSVSSQRERNSSSQASQRPGPPSRKGSTEAVSAHRAAVIRQHHPLVNRADRVPTASANVRGMRRESSYRSQLHTSAIRTQGLRSNSSCASQSTKKSKHSAANSRNYWDIGGSVGSGSVLAGEV
ncbi:hypothetical protein M011DRAFT_468018 [Sporormia fimetaria CBS 119925]|uniref:Uncharacterized protein n=1 Tax=Sporormia fimetaria CBS 119925 TaxID=1340428 RepID=A0A6A6V9D4_9PLEO|nr:hypothetical protein M011DRAFT_468018 [Sporormia fimetaria CBS 119925]